MIWSPAYTKADLKILKIKTIFSKFLALRILKYRYRKFDNSWSKAVKREISSHKPAVGVLLYDPQQEKILLIEQCRPGPILREYGSAWMLEIIAGINEPNETPAEVAQRESLEEAGVSAYKLLPICQYYASPGGSDEYFYLFCGLFDSSQAPKFAGLEHEDEDIKIHLFSISETKDLFARQQIQNAHTIIALQWLWLTLKINPHLLHGSLPHDPQLAK